MREEINMVPKRRFKEFQNCDAWEQRKLGELAEVRTGKAFSSSDFSDNGEYLVVTNKNIQDEENDIVSVGDRINISDDSTLASYLLSGDNILVTMDGVNIGKTGRYNNEKAVLAQRVGRLNSEQIEFVYQVTRSDRFVSEMNKLSVGNAIKHISLKQISEYSFSAPISEDEQKKIGTFFNQLDNLISLHQRKLEKTKALKSAYLSEMFPANGESEPKRRFAGFTDAWEQCRLSDVKDVRDGTHDSPKYHDEGYPLVTSKNLTEHGLDMRDVSLISYEDFKKINQRSKVDIGDIIFGMIGTIGNPVILNRDDIAIKNVALIKRDGEVENEFLIQLLKSPVFERYMNKENAGGTQKFLGLSQIRKFEFFMPTRSEQKSIGKFFYELDHLITLHQRKLEKLQNLKNAYLNEMFI